MTACLWTTCIVPPSWAVTQGGRKEKHVEGKKHGLGPIPVAKEKAEKDMIDDSSAGLEAALGMNSMATADEIPESEKTAIHTWCFAEKGPLEAMAPHLMTAGGEREIGPPQLERPREKHLRHKQ